MKAYIMASDILNNKIGMIVAKIPSEEEWKHWLKKHCDCVGIPEELEGKLLKAELIDDEWVLSEKEE